MSVFFLWPDQKPDTTDAIVMINGHPLTRQTIQEYKAREIHHGEDEDFINEIITKQLLIAEAQRLGIDKNPSFRLSLKTFYEHSLIKLLMEKVEQDISIAVSDEDVNSYVDSFGKTYTFYTMKTSQKPNTQTIKSKGTKHIKKFDDLSENIQVVLLYLQPGESTVSFLTGNEKLAIYLDSVEGKPASEKDLDTEVLRNKLQEAKFEAEVNSWIENLRNKASITYHNKQG